MQASVSFLDGSIYWTESLWGDAFTSESYSFERNVSMTVAEALAVAGAVPVALAQTQTVAEALAAYNVTITLSTTVI